MSKKASKKTAKKTTGKALAREGGAPMTLEDMERELAVQAQAAAEAEPAGGMGSIISTRGRRFTCNDADLGESLRVVVLLAVYANTYYETDFSPDAADPPDCAAVGEDPEEMGPPADFEDRQADACADCWANDWGSAGDGTRRKACANRRRLAVVLAEDLEAGVENPELAILTLPPTAINFWARYVKGLARIHARPPQGVVTTFRFREGFDYPCPTPEVDAVIEDPAFYGQVKTLLPEARELALTPPDLGRSDANAAATKKTAKKKAGKKKAAGKKAGKKTASRSGA